MLLAAECRSHLTPSACNRRPMKPRISIETYISSACWIPPCTLRLAHREYLLCVLCNGACVGASRNKARLIQEFSLLHVFTSVDAPVCAIQACTLPGVDASSCVVVPNEDTLICKSESVMFFSAYCLRA